MAIKLLPGTHVPHRKHTADCVPQRMPVAAGTLITVPLSMNIGAPAKAVVAPNDQVKVGQLIGEAGGFVSSPIYAGVSGKVKRLDEMLLAGGGRCQSIVIEADGEQTLFEGITPPTVTDKASFIDAVRASGVVGLGGAGFPTAVKLNVDPEKVDYICINGAECEPYITADTRAILDDSELLVEGIELLCRYLDPGRVVIGIEDNKPACIKRMEELTGKLERVTVRSLPSLYPQGGEKVLIHNITGRIVPEGKLPIDVGCVVVNTSTLVSMARYIRTGLPLVEKYVTVDGSAVANPMNVIAPIGMPIGKVVEFTGGCKCPPRKIIMGGPMMGTTVPDLEQPVMKNTGAILCLDEKDAELPPTTDCIRCGRCAAACPLRLMPSQIETAFKLDKPEELARLKVNLCMECGCCSFVCPAKRPLVQVNKLAKAKLMKYNAKVKEAAEKAKAKAEQEGKQA